MPAKIEVDKNKLYKLFIIKNMSRIDVAKELGIKESLVKLKLKQYGIKKPSDLHVQNIQKSCMKKYGVSNGGWTPEAQEKIKATNRAKFGYDFGLSSPEVQAKRLETVQEHYGVDNVFQSEEVKEKIKETNLKRRGVPHNMQDPECVEKTKQTNYERYGDSCYFNTEDYRNKSKETSLQRYGTEFPSQSDEVKKTGALTKLKNNNINTSKAEFKVFIKLQKKFSDVIHQYYSESYPWVCDFYIPSLDLYIEYQEAWDHGYAPYTGSVTDLAIIENWKAKNNERYNSALKTWIERDVKKRNHAKENNLNWIEFFTYEEFLAWFNKQ